MGTLTPLLGKYARAGRWLSLALRLQHRGASPNPEAGDLPPQADRVEKLATTINR
jgi:hypothetical protein